MPKVEAADGRFLKDALHIFVLSSFAIAQPLYDLLGRSAEFFVAHRVAPAGLVLFVVGISVLVPLVLIGMEALALLVRRPVRKGLHLLFVALLAALVVVPLVNRNPGLSPYVTVSIAAVAGIVFAAAYANALALRSFVTVLAPGGLVFPVLFLAFSPVSSLLGPKQSATRPTVDIKNPVPIVLVIFDEFEAGVLLDKNKQIDAVRFPNFAALAQQSWWFPNATTAWTETKRAVPAILTGLAPRDPGDLPTVQSHPDNLFTWLRGAYSLNVTETLTSLCPPDLCPSKGGYDDGFSPRLFLSDLSVAYLHVVLPSHWARQMLPPMDTGWKGFSRGAHADHEHGERPGRAGDRADQFTSFVTSLARGGANSLNFLHVLLPHVSYAYLPNGDVYQGAATEGLLKHEVSDGAWTKDDLLPTLAYHRFMLQVGFVDTLLGRMIDRLKAEGLYNSALVIITSDHGKSFRPGEPKRVLRNGNAADLLHVPLFLKLPGQIEGRRSERTVSNIDIVPTIAEVIGARLPWRTDGQSMIGSDFQEREVLELQALDSIKKMFRIPTAEVTSYPRLPWKIDTFGSGSPLPSVAIRHPYSHLLGHSVTSLAVSEQSSFGTARADDIHHFANVQPAGGTIPVHFRGEIRADQMPKGPVLLAVGLNGIISAVTRTTQWAEKPLYFSVMLPASSFREGRNELELFAITDAGGRPSLSRIALPSQEVLRIARDNAGDSALVSEAGKTFAIREDAAKGYLDLLRNEGAFVRFAGWAIEQQNAKPADRILVFADETQVYAGPTGMARPDLVKFFNNPAVRDSGFNFALPKSAIKRGSKIRLFSLSESGVAGELPIEGRMQAELASQ